MKRTILAVLLSAVLLSGCAAPAQQLAYAPAEENRLVIYTSHKEEVYRPIIREFEERTGIWVEVVTGGTNELLSRIAQEHSSPRADVMFGGGVETLQTHRDLFQQVQCPNMQAIAEEFQEEDTPWVPFSALPVVLIHNTKLVDPGDITGWADLLRPEFTGKIACADPSRSGSSFTALVTARYICGEDILRLMPARLRGHQLASSGDVLGAVADGSFLVGITLEETAMQRIAAGENINIVYPREGTSCIPDGTAVILDAAHRENAVRFLDFTLSEDVQQLLGSRFYRRAVREGIDAPQTLPPLEEISLIPYDAQWAVQNRNAILELWESGMQEAAK